MTDSVLHGVLPQAETRLRDLVTSLLPQGFAKIVQPIASTVITTDDKGLVAGEARMQTMTGPVPAYRAHPDKNGKFPLVLVVQEIFGVHEHIKDVCRRLAKLGYFAIAVELYHRQGDVSKMTDNQEIFAKVVNHVPDSQVMSDLDASVVYAESTGKADTSRLGVTGFCWGGRLDLLRAQSEGEGRRRMVWPAGRAAESAAATRLPGGACAAPQGAGAWLIRRSGREHPGCACRGDARRAQSRGQYNVGDHRLSRSAARLLRRLPAELPQGSGGRRLEENAGVVQEVWCCLISRTPRRATAATTDSPRRLMKQASNRAWKSAISQ